MEAHAPQVSVLLCVHNEKACVAATVESILAQTFSDFELLVVDDGSSDGTVDVINSFRDSRIVLIRQEHAGLTAALQRGLAAVRGAAIARIDAGDRALPERLQLQTEFLERHPETVLVCSGARGIDRDGNVRREIYPPRDGIEIAWRLLFYNCIVHSTVMFRTREARALGGYEQSLPFAQDHDLWLRIAERHCIGVIPQALMACRFADETSITACHADDQRRCSNRARLAALLRCDPELSDALPAVDELGAFIYQSGAPPRDPAAAERLLERLYGAFQASGFSASAPAERVRRVLVQPYLRFAWFYYGCGDRDSCHRCLDAAASGLQDVVPLPDDYPLPACDLLCAAVERYDRQDQKACLLRADQYVACAWQCLRRGGMREFRQALLRAWRIRPQLGLLLLVLASLARKRLFGEISAMRRQFRLLMQRDGMQTLDTQKG